MKLQNIKIGVSPITNDIYLYRHGKDPSIALDKRDLEPVEIYSILIEQLNYADTNESTIAVHGKDNSYEIRIKKVKKC